jgi:hypothetical protein
MRIQNKFFNNLIQQKISLKNSNIKIAFLKELGVYEKKNLLKSVWKDKINQKKFLEFIEKEFNFKSLEDWYKLKASELIERGGRGLLSRYNDSLFYLLSANYPEYDWKPWLFCKVPQSFWINKENQKKYLNWFAKKFNIKNLNDWYNISSKLFLKNGGGGLINNYGQSVYHMLQAIYPEHDWKPWLFMKVPQYFWFDTKKSKKLFKMVRREI